MGDCIKTINGSKGEMSVDICKMIAETELNPKRNTT